MYAVLLIQRYVLNIFLTTVYKRIWLIETESINVYSCSLTTNSVFIYFYLFYVLFKIRGWIKYKKIVDRYIYIYKYLHITLTLSKTLCFKPTVADLAD